MMQNSIGCVVSNGKWKNKSEFRVLKDVTSDNHTSSISAPVYSEKLKEFQPQHKNGGKLSSASTPMNSSSCEQ
jgi:hypothetical protein